jgi:protein-tyrosine-phosphatase
VLFVCEHGAAKSVVAAAHFNQLAADRGLRFRAISRGTAPDPSVPPRIIDGLKNEGLSVPADFAPSVVTVKDVSAATRVVTFDVTLPIPTDASRVSRWDNLPAFSDGYGPASEAVRRNVRSLIAQLESLTRKKLR